MKTTRTLLIEQAARDDADEGTEWRERMDAWLYETAPALLPVVTYGCDFGTITILTGPFYKYRRCK